MKKNTPLILLPVFLLLLPENQSGQERGPRLSESEIRVRPVVFINRTRRPAPARIRRRQIDAGIEAAEGLVRTGKFDTALYTISRIYDPQSEQLFGADLFSIKKRARIGHINYIHRILTGYLMKSFDYGRADAAVMARFLLYYNARRRGRLELLKPKYTPRVIAAVNPRKVGIARSFRYWPGRTEMLFPLVSNAARPGKADLNDDEVRKNAGRVTPKEKKQMDALQRRRRREDRKRLDEREKKIEEEKKKLEEEKKKTDEDLRKTEKRIKELRRDPVKNRKEIIREEKKKETLRKKEAESKKKEQKIAETQKKITEKRQDIARKEAEAKKTTPEKKTAAVTTESKKTTTPTGEKEPERKALVEKIKKEIKKKEEEVSKNVVQDKILFLRVRRYIPGGHYNNELWAIDAARDDTLYRGKFVRICSRTFLVIPEVGIVVVGYQGPANDDESEHNLVLLDPEEIRETKVSKESIFWRTPLIYRDDRIYVFEKNKTDKKHYLLRLTKDLTFDARSSDPINPDSTITFYKDKIYLTGRPRGAEKEGETTIQVFSRNDLKQLKVIIPQSVSGL